MGKRSRNKQHNSTPQTDTTDQTTQADSAMAFTFGVSESVLDASQILDYAECWQHEDYFEPPVSFEGLAKSFRAAPHHSSAI